MRHSGSASLEGRSTRKATMNDVARLAGVGLKTVSRVVNEETGVSPAVRKRVREAIKALGYRRNDSARVLRLGRTHSIGLVCEDLAEPFVSKLIPAIEWVALEHRCILIVAATGGDQQREAEAVQALATRQVDGLILAPTSTDQPYLQPELDAGLPVVFVDRPSLVHPVDAVLTDNRAGALSATRHLIGGGFRRIAFFGDSGLLYTQVERIEGYRQALESAKLAFDPSIVFTDAADEEETVRALRDMLQLASPPTAILTGNALCSYSVLKSFARLKCRLALVGFDDFSLSDLLVPSISVVEQSPSSIGRIAAELLFTRIQGDLSPPQIVRLGTTLIERSSSEPTNQD